MTEVKMHREFSLRFDEHASNPQVIVANGEAFIKFNEVISVIEISAVKELEAEIVKLKKDAEIRIATFKQQVRVNRKAWAEVEKLNKLLDKAVEGFLLIEEDNTDHEAQMKRSWGMSDFIHKTIAEIKEVRK